MKRILITTTTIAFGFTAQAHAQVPATPDDFVAAVVEHFNREGYDEVEVYADGMEVTVEAVRDGYAIETTYDARDGDVLSHEVERYDEDDDVGEGGDDIDDEFDDLDDDMDNDMDDGMTDDMDDMDDDMDGDMGDDMGDDMDGGVDDDFDDSDMDDSDLDDADIEDDEDEDDDDDDEDEDDDGDDDNGDDDSDDGRDDL